MSNVNDFCRLCRDNLRYNGVLRNTTLIWERGDFNVFQRLLTVGVMLERTENKSCRVCKKCVRSIQRIEQSMLTIQEWRRSEKTDSDVRVAEKRRRESPSKTPRELKMTRRGLPATPSRTTERASMPPPRHIVTESADTEAECELLIEKVEGAAAMHCGAVETRETGWEAFTGGGGGEDSSSPCGLEDHGDGEVTARASGTELLSQDLNSAAPWRTAACTVPLFDCLQFLPVCKEEVSYEQHETMSGSLVQVNLEPPQIKNEQEEGGGSTLTLLAVKSEDDESGEAERYPASTSTEAYTHYWVPTTGDQQLLSSHGSESDTEDSEDWASHCSESDAEDRGERKTRDESESVSDAQKSHKTQQRKPYKQIPRGKKGFGCMVYRCNRRFVLERNLQKHMKTHRVRPFVCEICSRSYVLNAYLKIHMKIHPRPYPCNTCGTCFKRISHLKSHKLIHTGEKPFTCTVCSKGFTKEDNLKNHMFTHTGERPFACSICGKSFSFSWNLKKHMVTHMEKKPSFPCTICSKICNDLTALKRHMETHTDGKTFTCTVCSRQVKHLKRHMSLVHREKPFVCTVCNKSFALESYLKSHMRFNTC